MERRVAGLLALLLVACGPDAPTGSNAAPAGPSVSAPKGASAARLATPQPDTPSPTPAPRPAGPELLPAAARATLPLLRYRPIGTRPTRTLRHSELRRQIDAWADALASPSLDGLVRPALALTAQRLAFSFERTEREPDRLAETGLANCVGYAIFFTAVFDHATRRAGLSSRYRAKHRIGKITVLGQNVHQLFSSPFFRDHDYVEVHDRREGETRLVDPSLFDYAGVGYVSAGREQAPEP